jgi:signal transduction histidine kinase
VVWSVKFNDITLSEDDNFQITNLVDQASTVIQSLRLKQEMSDRLQELTTLQRLMSHDAWSSYQTQANAEKGYSFDQINIHPEIQLPSVEGNIESHLSVRGERIGILGVKQDGEQMISTEDEAFLNAISEQVAQALERARLLEQTKKSAIELQAVAEVGTATATILEPDQLLKQVVNLTLDRFGLYQALVFLLDDLGANLNITAGAGSLGDSLISKGWSIPIDKEDSLVAKVAKAQEGQFIHDISDMEGFVRNPLLPKTRSELAVPLLIAGELLGVFDVHSDVIGRFTDDDIRTFSTLAAQVTVALQNARLYAEQLATVERLRELDNMKSAFLANMSHELRTPLNSILGFTQVILEGIDGPLTDTMVSDLELIEKNGVHLLNLINDVLDMAKIEAGRFSLNLEAVNLYDLVEEVLGTSEPLSREKALAMKMVADSNQDWTIKADLVRIKQIMINLVGNSIKFTDKGDIDIELDKYLATDEAEYDKIQVRVRDTGIGIPKIKLEEIFEAFSQIDTSTTRKVGGTGLGLPISRRLVELHGGRLWAESEGEGKGAVFYLELPTEPRVEETSSEFIV